VSESDQDEAESSAAEVRAMVADLGLRLCGSVLDGDCKGQVMVSAATSVSDASNTNPEVAMANGPLVSRKSPGRKRTKGRG